MQPKYLSLLDIFGLQTRYTVPLFQRPYVWNQEEQWEPLWDDISDLSDRVLLTKPENPIAGHFLGTLVLEQLKTQTGSVGSREIIDGQQRLTTLQILLTATIHSCKEVAQNLKHCGESEEWKAVDLAARQLQALTANPAYAVDEEKYKVWPTNDDRTAFCQVMDADGPENLSSIATRIAHAYRFFTKGARDWLTKDQFAGPRAAALAAALKDHLRLIVLDLDNTDEPQAIFETLNAYGTPLLPADLIKNWLLWEAGRQKLQNIQSLYETYWRFLDHDDWRRKIGSGHAARARVDTFLQNWLTRRTGAAIPVKHLYDHFLQDVAPRVRSGQPPPHCDVPAVMADIYADGRCYQDIEGGPGGSTRFDTFLRRLAKLDIVVFHPVLLALMRRAGSDVTDRDNAGATLESYLVRRVVCLEQTRGYGDLAIELLQAISKLDSTEPAAPTIIDHLSKSTRFHWPNDTEFRASWCLNRFYGGYRRARVQMILESIEEYYQYEGGKGEPIVYFDFSKVEIEHILPQKWQENWALPAVENAHFERERRLHGIGNLTLVSGKLNPTLSNAAWAESAAKRGKRSALDDHSKLQLNAKLVKANPDNWDEAAIDKRAVELFKVARKIWPQPPGFPEVVISGDDVAVSKAPPEFLPPPIEPPKYLPSERIIERGHRLATRQTKVSFRGSEGNFRTDKGAYIWLLRKFVAAFPDLMKTASYAIKSNERLFFARTPQELFTASPHLAEDPQKYAQITDEGDSEKWFANVNIDTQRTKLLNLDLLSSIAGFKRGEDWTWEQKRDYIEVLDL